MKASFGLFVVFCNASIYCVLSQNLYCGSCDRFGQTRLSASAFTQNKYMGHWFIQRTYDYSAIAGRDCLTSTYIETTFRNAKIVELSKDLRTNQRKQIDSFMVFDDQGTGHYKYQVPAENVDDSPIDIIATDFETYSIEWSCSPNGSNSDTYIWIMSRHRQVGDEFWAIVDPILRQHCISKGKMRIVIQDEDICSD